MPRWLVGVIIVILILAFVIPNPTGAGTALGNAVAAFVSFVSATVIGLLVSQLRLSRIPPLVWLTSVYIDIFRCTPALVQIVGE